eukprot:TRINITY_DN28443_c0_g1_i1.p3 TRINITY_DN28443_c0_g1~~TRINITY_DN28443_c0_g1_i1.p3  ORF type:complete len:131 (+),score=0.35 TRINITY_DN28443_c0_g1_i1:496-888(+)
MCSRSPPNPLLLNSRRVACFFLANANEIPPAVRRHGGSTECVCVCETKSEERRKTEREKKNRKRKKKKEEPFASSRHLPPATRHPATSHTHTRRAEKKKEDLYEITPLQTHRHVCAYTHIHTHTHKHRNE